jgi:hypothetical protein
MKFITIIIFFINLSAWTQTKIKCLCSMDPTPSGASISHVHQKGEWMFSYRYMRMNMEGNLEGNSSIQDENIFNNYLGAGDKMNMDMHMLMGMYGITDRFTGMMMVNYLNNFMTMNMVPTKSNSGHEGHSHSSEGGHEMKTTGLGDLQLGLLYGLLMEEENQLILSTEISIPTGSINKKGPLGDMMYNDKRYPYTMQLGTGTFDLSPKITYLLEKGDGTFCVQGGVSLPLNKNTLGYKRSSKLTASSWFAYKLGANFTSSIRTVFRYSEAISGKDNLLYRYTEPAANTMNYGSTHLSSFIGSTFHFLSVQRIAFEVGFPLYQNVLGIQMKDKLQLNLSYTIKI